MQLVDHSTLSPLSLHLLKNNLGNTKSQVDGTLVFTLLEKSDLSHCQTQPLQITTLSYKLKCEAGNKHGNLMHLSSPSELHLVERVMEL